MLSPKKRLKSTQFPNEMTSELNFVQNIYNEYV